MEGDPRLFLNWNNIFCTAKLAVDAHDQLVSIRAAFNCRCRHRPAHDRVGVDLWILRGLIRRRFLGDGCRTAGQEKRDRQCVVHSLQDIAA
jgi:hypothetical protein